MMVQSSTALGKAVSYWKSVEVLVLQPPKGLMTAWQSKFQDQTLPILQFARYECEPYYERKQNHDACDEHQ